jgi:hypothetical protein
MDHVGSKDEDEYACNNLQNNECRIRQHGRRQVEGEDIVNPGAHLWENKKPHCEERRNRPEGAEEPGDGEHPQEVAVKGDSQVRRNEIFTEMPVAYGVALHQPTDEAVSVCTAGQHHRINLPRSSREASTRSRSVVKA